MCLCVYTRPQVDVCCVIKSRSATGGSVWKYAALPGRSGGVGRLVLQGDGGFIKGPASLSMTQACSFACRASSLDAARLDDS